MNTKQFLRWASSVGGLLPVVLGMCVFFAAVAIGLQIWWARLPLVSVEDRAAVIEIATNAETRNIGAVLAWLQELRLSRPLSYGRVESLTARALTGWVTIDCPNGEDLGWIVSADLEVSVGTTTRFEFSSIHHDHADIGDNPTMVWGGRRRGPNDADELKEVVGRCLRPFAEELLVNESLLRRARELEEVYPVLERQLQNR